MMRTLPKIIFMGSMIALTVSGLDAMADECNDRQGYRGGMMGMDPHKMEAMRAEHQHALHDILKLDARQETAWKKYVASTGQAPIARPDKDEVAKLNAPQRLEKMLEGMRKHEARLSEHLAALKEFYAVLTPEQQKAFDEHAMPHQHDGMRGQRR